jgi:hypothetical protein
MRTKSWTTYPEAALHAEHVEKFIGIVATIDRILYVKNRQVDRRFFPAKTDEIRLNYGAGSGRGDRY